MKTLINSSSKLFKKFYNVSIPKKKQHALKGGGNRDSTDTKNDKTEDE